ncbi:MAG: hypothetical protein IKZ46_00855 [Victivallales bacterium]|nr:hypothetical protein [Victivallales bacterium]
MKKRISRVMSNRTVILAIDSGGTKCEMLAVDAATGEVVREVRHQADSLPAACRPKQNFGGAGRTSEVLGYCLDEMLDGLDFQKLLPTGNVSKEMVEKELERHGLTAEDYQPVGEIDGVFYSEAMTWGIAISAGTGTVGMVWPPKEKQADGPLLNGRVADVVQFANSGRLLIDAVGPLLGDWGSAYSIGLDFLRRAYREQESQTEPLAEMQAICAHLDAFSGIERKPDEKKLTDNYRHLSHFIYTYTDRSIIASLSRVCGDCAKNGSELAESVLLSAGSDLAESVIRAAKRSGIAKMDFPVLASGSVLMNDDIVYGAMKERLEREMPQAKLIRAARPQVCGQIVARFMKMDPVNYRIVMLNFFAKYHDYIHNKKS